jgi:hypothetical protein
MIEDALGEGFSLSVSSEHAGEAEWFWDGKIWFDQVKGCAWDLHFFDDLSSSLVEGLIDTAHAVAGSSDLAAEDGFYECGFWE